MSRKQRARVRAAAYHEAGHTVAALHMGFRVARVVIHPESTDRGGYTLIANIHDKYLFDDPRIWFRRYAITLASGPAAHGKLIRNYCWAWFAGGMDDRERLNDYKHCGDDYTYDMKHQADSVRFVREHWNEIAALAERLQQVYRVNRPSRRLLARLASQPAT